ncbi:hypothetical protein HT031_001565 [Scenedesmus sp. PABB004]|nr:hypothetical protein HT031_001565 [Scenedesmus sp. PABB004]
MLRADVSAAHILPRSVADALGSSEAAAGCSADGGHAWALHRQTLLLWRVADGLHASVRRLHLAEAPEGRVLVEVLAQSGSSAVTVVACTGGGQLSVWLDANFPAPPLTQRLFVAGGDDDGGGDEGGGGGGERGGDVVTALAAAPAGGGGGGGAGPGFVAALATSDGGLHLYHGSAAGVFPRTFHKPGAGAGPRAGVLGTLGSVVRALYSEAFDPLHREQRAGPSALPARQLALAPLGGGRWRLLALTPESLDCWLLGGGAGQHAGEALAWSYNLHGVLAGALGARELTVLAFAARGAPAAGGGGAPQLEIAIWSAHLGGASLSQQHAVSLLALGEGGKLPALAASAALPAASSALLPQPQPDDRLSRWCVLPHSRFASALLLAPNGVILEWLPAAGAPHVLGASDGNLAIGVTPGSSGAAGAWLLLNAHYGVLEFAAEDPAAAHAQAAPAPGGALTPEAAAAASELLGKTVALMHKEFSAGCAYRELAEGLGERLRRLGALGGAQGTELLVAASSGLVDTVAKAGSAAASSGSLRALLQDKAVRHDLLLAAYQAGGVMGELPAGAVRAVLGDAEKLAAVAAVLDWQRASEAAAGAGDAASGVTTAQTAAAAAAIEAAGVIAAEGVDGAAGAGRQWEVFFSRPAASMPALFCAAAAEAAAVQARSGADDRGGAAHALQQLLGLAGLLQAGVGGAQAKAAELAEAMPAEAQRAGAAGPSWLSGEGPRQAWGAIADACLALHARLPEPSQRLALAHGAHLPALQALLAGLRDTLRLSAAPPAGVQAAYARVPAQHGACLLADAEEELSALRVSGVLAAACEAAAALGGEGVAGGGESVAAVQRALVWRLESLAAAHRCHALLFDACELLLTTGLVDGQRLQGHMRAEMSAAGGGALPADCFTFFVMERWRAAGQLGPLLRLGRAGFAAPLRQYLAAHSALLWMSEVQAGDAAAAAATLATAAAAEQGSVAKARRLLCLSKLAAHASSGGPADPASARLQAAASARLRALALQEALGLGGKGPLSTAQLALAALAAAGAGGEGAADAAVAAVEALALAPQEQASEQYRELWDRAWAAVLQATPLDALAAARGAARRAGGDADAYEAAARGSPLFAAILRAAAALADAAQAQGDVAPAEVLDGVGLGLLARCGGAAAEAVEDVLAQAAAAAAPLLEAAPPPAGAAAPAPAAAAVRVLARTLVRGSAQGGPPVFEELTAIDASPLLLRVANCPVVWLDHALDAARLAAALGRVLDELPLLGGRLARASAAQVAARPHLRAAPYFIAATRGGGSALLVEAATAARSCDVDLHAPLAAPFAMAGAPRLGPWHQPLDVAALLAGREPLLKLQLTQLADGGCVLAVTMPHLLADASSSTQLLARLAAAYRTAGAPAPAGEPAHAGGVACRAVAAAVPCSKAALLPRAGAGSPGDAAKLEALSLGLQAADRPSALTALRAVGAALAEGVAAARRFPRAARLTSCVLLIPAGDVARLKALAAGGPRGGAGAAAVSTNDALSALVWLACCELRGRPLPGSGGGGVLGVAIDLRLNAPDLALPPDLFGNAAWGLHVSAGGAAAAARGGAEPAEGRYAAALQAGARAVRGALARFRAAPDAGATLLALVAQQAAAPWTLTARNLAHLAVAADVFVTSWARVDLAQLDFGGGCTPRDYACAVRPTPPWQAAVLPRPPDGAARLLLTVPCSALEALRRSPVLAQLVPGAEFTT